MSVKAFPVPLDVNEQRCEGSFTPDIYELLIWGTN